MIINYLLLVVLWCCWCTLHSWLISTKVSAFLQDRFGDSYRFFRVAYNFLSLITLLIPLVFCYRLQAAEEPLFVWSGWWLGVKYLVLGLSFFFFVSGSLHYDLAQFLGITQVKSGHNEPLLVANGTFSTRGIMGVTRHPWYFGGILFVWSTFNTMYFSTLITSVIITGYFIIGTLLEERKLVALYGDAYENYRKEVSMLFPSKWLRRRLPKIIGGK